MKYSKNINKGDVNTNCGDFRIGDNFYKSAEYQDFQKQISRLQRLMELTDDMSEKLEFSKELNELQNQLEAFKRDIIQLAETFQKIDIDTERLRLAKQHFDNGEYKEEKLQKINRYYISRNGVKLTKVHKTDGREIQLEAGKWLQTVFNKMECKPKWDSYNINIGYYLEAVEQEINNILNVPSKQMKLF